MIALPVAPRRDPTPLATRRTSPGRTPDVAQPAVTPSGVEGQLQSPSLEEQVAATVDAALAEALAKVKTPEDDALAQQQAAFDRLMQARAEQLREVNAIRDLGMEQMKKENAYMEAAIKMI